MRLTILAALAVLGGVLLAAPVPEKKEPPEPEWMANFRKAYQLKDGEYVKRVPKPLPSEREEFELKHFYKTLGTPNEAKSRQEYAKWAAKYSTLFVEQDGKALNHRMSLSSAYLQGQPNLQRGDNLLTAWDTIQIVTEREEPEVVIDPKSKDDFLFTKGNLTVSGDFVIRKDAPLDKLAPQLEKILRDECQLNVKLTMKNEEQEVFVVGGKFGVKPPEWRGDAKNAIGLHMLDVYATEDGLNREFDHFDFKSGQARRQAVQSMGYSGKPVEFVRFIGDRVRTRMVWDSPLPAEPKFMWHNHTVKNPTKEQEAEDCDPEKVLKNVSVQTGLTFKKEKRKVPVLVVSVPQ